MNEKEIEDVYEDRNLLVCAFAQITEERSGWKPDPESPDSWAIVWIQSEYGQMAWHVPRDLVEQFNITKAHVEYDGYDRDTKNWRLKTWLRNHND